MTIEHSFLITGASSFLGKAFAQRLSKNEDYKVFLTSRSETGFKDLLEKRNVSYLPDVDLTVDSDLEKLSEAVDAFIPGTFHIINCLGYFPAYASIQQMDLTTAKKIFDSNVIALYGVANKFLPLMSIRKGGHFFGFSAHTVYQHYPEMAAFTAAKAAVESLIKGIANEYLDKGINANAIALATLYTETELKIKPKGDIENWLHPEEVCELVESLILQPSKLISGNVIHAYKYSDSYFHQSYFERINS